MLPIPVKTNKSKGEDSFTSYSNRISHVDCEPGNFLNIILTVLELTV